MEIKCPNCGEVCKNYLEYCGKLCSFCKEYIPASDELEIVKKNKEIEENLLNTARKIVKKQLIEGSENGYKTRE